MNAGMTSIDANIHNHFPNRTYPKKGMMHSVDFFEGDSVDVLIYLFLKKEKLKTIQLTMFPCLVDIRPISDLRL